MRSLAFNAPATSRLTKCARSHSTPPQLRGNRASVVGFYSFENLNGRQHAAVDLAAQLRAQWQARARAAAAARAAGKAAVAAVAAPVVAAPVVARALNAEAAEWRPQGAR